MEQEKQNRKTIYVERMEEKVDDIGVALPHYGERDEKQSGGQLKGESTENGSRQWIEDVEDDRA